MNDPHDPTDAMPQDEPSDRLTDQALQELLGDDRPPDLSARILAAAAAPPVTPAPPPTSSDRPAAPSRRELALAASVLVLLIGGLAALFVPAIGGRKGPSIVLLTDGAGSMSIPDPIAAKPADGTTNQLPAFVPNLSLLPPGASGSPGAPTQDRRYVDIRALPLLSDIPIKSEGFELQGRGSGHRDSLVARHGGTVAKGLADDNDGLRRDIIDARNMVDEWRVKSLVLNENRNQVTGEFGGLAKAGSGTQTMSGLRHNYTDGTAIHDQPMVNQLWPWTASGVADSNKPSGTTTVNQGELKLDGGWKYRDAVIGTGDKSGKVPGTDAPTALAVLALLSIGGGEKPGPEGLPAKAKAPGDNQGETEEGRGPGQGGDRYRRIVENLFLASLNNPLSTFSIDVDTASYSNLRQFVMQQGTVPPPDAVRIEELVNYFHYNYAGPKDERPFAVHVEMADCPWQGEHRLLRIALKGREIDADKRPRANLVFLIDVSGSMNEPNKLPLLVSGLKLLTEQLRADDQVSIVVYAGSEGLVLPATPGASRETILAALDQLSAGGSTNGGAGINLAYKLAKEGFIQGGINRVILCTDGDFNVGVTSDGALERLVEEKAKEGTFLTVLGFGRGNLNDTLLKSFSTKANGNYAYVDNLREARKVLVEQLTGTILTIAKDVKIQVEFNPTKVAGFRLLGYENRILAAEDFNNDKKDAGEIGAGHTVTALYEIVPAGKIVENAPVDPLKYQTPQKLNKAAQSGELMTLKLRYKEPQSDKSKLMEEPIPDETRKFAAASSDFQWAAAVVEFGLLLRGSKFKGTATYDAALEIATQNRGDDKEGYRREFLEIVRKAKGMAK